MTMTLRLLVTYGQDSQIYNQQELTSVKLTHADLRPHAGQLTF